MREHLTDGVRWFQFENLGERVTHGVFGRQGGVSEGEFASLNCGLSSRDLPDHVNENRRRVRAILPDHPPFVTMHPVHGAEVIVVRPEDVPDHSQLYTYLPYKADAMITQARGIALFMSYADCTPIVLADPIHDAVALVHAGWRGTSIEVVMRTVEAMRDAFGTRPTDLRAGIAPAIGACHYEVDAPVQAAFAANAIAQEYAIFSTVLVPEDGGMRASLRLDVAASNYGQLVAAGIPPEQIELSEICTGCRTDLFFSHRTEQGHTGRFGVAIGLR
jgi:polyphenol oxidase